MGEYFFESYPVVYGQSHVVPEEIALTAAHESEHRRMASATSFGFLQLVTALLANGFRKVSRLQEAEACERTLDRLIKESWSCHEGAATVKEYAESVYDHFQFRAQGLPQDYQLAMTKVQRLAQFISDDSLHFFDILTVTLVECAMNTRILERAVPADICHPETFGFLENVADNPDKRLDLMYDLVRTQETGGRLEEAIRNRLFTTVDSFERESGRRSETPNSISDLYAKYVRKDLYLWQRCNYAIQEEALSVLHALHPEFVYYDWRDLCRVRRLFSAALASYMDELSLPPIDLVVEDDDPDFSDPEWWLSWCRVVKTFCQGYTIFDTGEFDVESTLQSIAATGSWVNVHIMANSLPIAIPLSYDGEVTLGPGDTIALLVPGIAPDRTKGIEQLPLYFCYRDSFQSLMKRFQKTGTMPRTITTTERSYDLVKRSFRIPVPGFEIPNETAFCVYVTMPPWDWIGCKWDALSTDGTAVLYLDPKHRMHLIVTVSEERRYHVTALDNGVMGLLYQHEPSVFLKHSRAAREALLETRKDGETIAALISLFFLGMADKL